MTSYDEFRSQFMTQTSDSADHYTLFFSSRVYENTGGSGAFANVTGLSACDIGTSGTFTTAPEPEPAGLPALGAISAGVIRARKRRQS